MNKSIKALLIVLIAAGIIALFLHRGRSVQISSLHEVTKNILPNTQSISESTQKNEPKPLDPFWNTITEKQLLDALQAQNYLPKIFINETLDLTGDSVPEGISLQESYPYVYHIFLKNSDGSIQVAKQKNKDGSIRNVELDGFARGSLEEGYEFLPDEHGYYTTFLDGEDTGGILKCKENSVQAYAWNLQTKLFEYNEKLTQKYYSKFCVDYK